MTTNAPRAPIDFDAFERDLRQAAQNQPDSPAGSPAPKADPLAELARIVGQDDPFRALLEARQVRGGDRPADAAAGRQGGRVEPSFHDAPESGDSGHEAAQQSGLSPADAFDQYLASVEHGAFADDGGAHPQGHAQDPAAFADKPPSGYRAFIARQPRKRLVQVGAALGILGLSVGGALAVKGLRSGGADGGPVTVLADKTPLKVAPQAADGVEIPDQNKQIYDRNAKDGQIKVVNREEQPLDVAQAARASAGRNGGSGATTPGNTAMLTDSLGEPRRVRTVAVKPDTPPASVAQSQAAEQAAASKPAQAPAQSPAQPQREASAQAAREPISPIPTMTMPDASTTATPAAATRRPSRTLASTSAPGKPEPAQAEASEAAPPAADPAPASRKPAKRVAAVGPESAAVTETPADAAASGETHAAAASTASVGGYSVQLGVRNSEADARAAFKQMQTKYSQLGGKPELIRQAEVDGKSLYRVRVGPLAKNEATSLCTALKGAGGQCFVAKN